MRQNNKYKKTMGSEGQRMIDNLGVYSTIVQNKKRLDTIWWSNRPTDQSKQQKHWTRDFLTHPIPLWKSCQAWFDGEDPQPTITKTN